VGAPVDGSGFDAKFLAHCPLTEAAKRDLRRLYDSHQPDYLAGASEAHKKLQLARMSYRDYLLKIAKVDPSLLWFFARATEGWYCVPHTDAAILEAHRAVIEVLDRRAMPMLT